MRSVALSVEGVSRHFGRKEALRGVSLQVAAGEIHALLGPNGAGKTTLLRILAGLVEPDAGTLRLLDTSWQRSPSREGRRLLGVVPSGDRSFYLRITGVENLVFFARLYGLSRRRALRRARECLSAVGLAEAGQVPVGNYSHGMQKRLGIARALLMDPPVLLVDEATHDLDPEGGLRIRELIATAAARGTAVLWTTQQLDEIRGFAEQVTVLDHGQVRFAGTVAQLMDASRSVRHVLRLRDGTRGPQELLDSTQTALSGLATVAADPGHSGHHVVIALADRVTLGQALTSLAADGIDVLACREERSQVEAGFLRLTGGVQS